MVPLIAAADVAIEAFRISAEGIRLIVAVYVPGHGVSEHPAQHCATHDRAAIAMADGRTDQTACGGAKDRSSNDIAAAAALFIFPLVIVVGGLVETRGGAITLDFVLASALIIGRAHAAIHATSIIIAALVRLAVITIRISLRAVILGRHGQPCCK